VQRESLYRYQQTIQNGFREVDDALADRAKLQQRLQALGRQVEALRTYARLARLRYDEGYTSYLEVLDAERSLFNIEISYTAAQNTHLRAAIDLYKAMGGGWVVEAEKLGAPKPEEEAGFIP
jgi:multidrug efflux system outer membrane protein